MKKGIFVFIFLFLFFYMGCPCPVFAEEKVELKVSHFWPPTSAQHELLLKWKKKLEDESKGKLSLRIFPGGTLLKQTIEWEGLNKGVADIVYGIRLETAGREFSEKMVIFTYGAKKASVGGRLMYDVFNQFQAYRDEWKTVKVLWLAAAGPNQIHTKAKPIRKLEDLKGMQLRTAPGAGLELVRTLGASPVTMPMSETFMAIQKGTVEGCLGPADILKNFRLDEVTKYTTNANLWVLLGHYVAMNTNSYNNLPSELKNIIDNSMKWGREETWKMYDSIDEESINYAKRKGHTFMDLSSDEMTRWYSVIKPLQDKIAAELDANGYPGTKLKDFLIQRVKYYSGEGK
jgi:TRAP-type C4-dicarboxylate transport system substrate-binding protein